MALEVFPFGDKITVEVDKVQNETVSGIVLPDKEDKVWATGVVKRVGNGGYDMNGKIHELRVKPGDRVVFQAGHTNPAMAFSRKGSQPVIFLTENDIVAIIAE